MYLCLRGEEVGLGVRPAGGDEVKVLAGGLPQQPGAADDVVVVDLDEALLPGLPPSRSQAAEGHVRPAELKRVVFLRESTFLVLNRST